MNLNVDVRPGSTNEKILNILLDGEWHSHAELREKTHCHKTQISAGLHRLKFYYGYILEVALYENANRVRLLGRSKAAQPTTVPTIGTLVTVSGQHLGVDGSILLYLRDTEGNEFKTLMAGETVSSKGEAS